MAAELKDVPSGVEAATLGGCTLPEYAKATVHCQKLAWIFDEVPRIQLDFGSDHKKFHFKVGSSIYDLFKSETEFKFERTKTDTTFTCKKTSRNPPSRMSILEEYTKKYLELLVVDKFEVHFNQFQKYDIINCFIWKITNKLYGIYFNPTQEVVFTPEQIRFLLEDVTAQIFTLPKIKLSSEVKLEVLHSKPIKHERINFYCEFLPFEYFIKMECKRVIARTDMIHVADLNEFVKAWIRGKRLLNLKSFIIHFSDMKGNLTYEEVLRDIKSSQENKKEITELDVSSLNLNDDGGNEGHTIVRSVDDALATVLLKDKTFSLIIKD
ncbi:unnamed protein product [Caenorhabditis brenneri]